MWGGTVFFIRGKGLLLKFSVDTFNLCTLRVFFLAASETGLLDVAWDVGRVRYGRFQQIRGKTHPTSPPVRTRISNYLAPEPPTQAR